MRCTTLLALLTGVMLYLVMGALVFRTLEAPKESSAYEDLLKTKQTFLDNNSCVTELDFHELVKRVVSAVEAGLDVSNLPANFTSRWDLASAFFFCGTIITTIGFGNLSPRTWYGQLFCVCYALVGIPMFGILLAGVGDHMGTVLRRAVAKIETLFLKRKVRPTTVRVSSAVLSILIGCLIFLAVPTVVFQKVEDWSFLESLYFVVITLTTVGFGDYVPSGGGGGGMFFKPLVWLWIVFGLAYFASILTMISNWLRVLSKKTRAEMEELRAHATDWTQNIQNMSMDFRIPNPLEFNDPFLLQRRRWKRSERRRIRRGAQVTLGYWVRGGSENGHLPNRWAGLSSSMKLDSPDAAIHGESLSGSESPFDSRSDGSSDSMSFLAFHRLQPCRTVSSMEEDGVRAKSTQPKDKPIQAEKCGPVAKYSHRRTPPPLPQVLLPSHPLNIASSVSCQLLDFFGENLAYIDESSDTLSDRAQPAAGEEQRRRPRKPKRRSMKRQLSHKLSPLQVRSPTGDMQPPSNPPTPPPDCSVSDLPRLEKHTDSDPTL
uniref:potassium channel subfamily K member 4 n=1 Tax=Monopterus albus TaxID=43700 RepID=UPI0009B41191|nr:potassium channel subfamily K member 4 [Monopterus albus]